MITTHGSNELNRNEALRSDAGDDARGVHGSIKNGLEQNTLHGINISVNDWAHAFGSIDGFDDFSSQLAVLDGIRGTSQAEREVRSLLDERGFTYNDNQIRYWLEAAPESASPSSGGGGGGSNSPVAPTEQRTPIERIEDAAEATRDEISPEPSGLADTINTTDSEQGKTAFDQEAVDRNALDAIEDREVTNSIAPALPSERVVDPATGQIYANPAAARSAGITNYVYVVDGEG